jgi:hypothetical protein
MDEPTADTADPREEIARLEARIEELAGRIENCRKFILASRIAMTLGGLWFAALLVGAVWFDPLAMTVAIVAVLGGFVISGSNRSTAQEAADEMAAAGADRAALIGLIDLRVVAERPTLH